MITRREMLAGLGAAIAFKDDTLRVVERLVANVRSSPKGIAEDEAFWAQIQQAFTLDRTMVNLNNGGVCPSPRVVQDALRRMLEYSNQAPSFYMWRHLETEIDSVRRGLAKAFACDAEEVAITRNASEALETCLFGFDLGPGDEILTTTLDYPRMITTIQQREKRDGIKMVQAKIPHRPTSQIEIVEAIERAITSRTKLVLVCHVIFLNGQVLPVRRIIAMCRARGIPVIVDGAHAFAQFPFSRDDLDCEYYGTSLHKWLMAPVGTGMLYVKKEKISSLWPLMAAPAESTANVRKFEEIGTHPAANHNAIAEALAFHEMIGAERKAARLRYLRSIWTEPLLGIPSVRFHTNLAAEHSCGLTTVEISGIKTEDLANWLWEKHRIFITAINHDQFTGIRVTPNVYTTLEEIRRFSDAMVIAATKGIA